MTSTCLAAPATRAAARASSDSELATVTRDVQLIAVCHPHHLRMFHALGNYFHERRRGLTKAAGYVGGAYLVGRYVSERLKDVRTSILQERAAREK